MTNTIRTLTRCLFLAASLPLGTAVSFAWQNGDTIYVNKAALGNGNGRSWNDAFKSIQAAVLSVTPGTQVNIFVAQGLYPENNIVLSEGIKLYGSFDGHESSLAERRDVWTNDHWTVIDAQRKHRVLRMKDKTEVNGFTLRNGLRDYTLQTGVTLEESRGGGIYVECDDDVVVRNNIIERSAVYWQGGGIFIDGGCNNTPAAPLIEFNVIRSCTGYCGGGIEIDGVNGGGGTDAIIRHNILRNNPNGGTAEQGFGLELWTGYVNQCSPRMGDFYNNIIIGFHNVRDWNIDAADVWAWARNSTDHSFISQQWIPGEPWYPGCYNFDNPANQNLFASDPMFVDEAKGDYRLREGSPCIGAGRGGVDIGLYPYQGDTQPPLISGVSSRNMTSTAATVTWSTDEPADGQLEYGLTTSYESLSSPNHALTSNHSLGLSALSPSTTYHYRVRSRDGVGNLSLSGDYSFKTALPQPTDGYAYRKQITIDYTKVASGCSTDLTAFPVLVRISNDVNLKTRTNGGHVVSPKGFDIVFKSPDGQTQFPHEIEKYDATAGTLLAWVKVPTVYRSQNTSIYLYYGNDKVIATPEAPASVWDNRFQAVWHLKEDPSITGPQMRDSTSSGLNGTARGAMTTSDRVAAKVGWGLDFDGADDALDLGNGMNNVSLPFTIEGWLYHRGTAPCPNCRNEVIVASDDGPTYEGFWLQLEGGTYELTVSYGDGKSSGGVARRSKHSTKTIPPGVWTHVAAVVRGATDMTLYMDGVQVAGTYSGTGGSMAHSASPARLAVRGSNFLNGILDEVRVSNVARTACWIKTGYLNQKNPWAFHSVGPEEVVR